MISKKIIFKKLFIGILSIAAISCSSPWDDHENNGDENLDVKLNIAVSQVAEASEFGKLLVQSGYDKILAGSKTYTVFVPTNEALAEVDNQILNNPDELKKFVANHIALTSYSSVRSTAQEKVKMLSDKYLIFNGKKLIDDATIVKADHYAANGVFHVINKALTPKLNIWQYINAQAGNSAMSDYILSLKEFNIYKSDSLSKAISETAGAGYLADSLTNSFLKNVYNLNNEKNSYTLFLMEDDGFNEEVEKMKPYLIKSNADSTAIYAKYFTVRDMVFPQRYELSQLPATLTSKFGVVVEKSRTQVVGQPIRLSNGIVYIMKKVDVALDKRLVATKIEGENNNSYWFMSRSRIFYRDRDQPGVANSFFQDIMVQNPGVRIPTLNYSAKDMYSTTYQVYWRAINDVQSNVFQQQLRIGGTVNADFSVTDEIKLFDYTDVGIKNYDEVYIGDFTLEEAGNIDLISLIGGNTTTNGNNSLSLDYLKFIPVVK